ncbi:MAG: glycosyltransferase [bacterium]
MAHRKFNHYIRCLLAAEINRFARYYKEILQPAPLGHDDGELLRLIENNNKTVKSDFNDISDQADTDDSDRIVLLNGTLNYNEDIHELLQNLHPRLSRSDRVVAIVFNPYFRWLYPLANLLGLRDAAQPVTFVTKVGIENIARATDYEIVRMRTSAYFPFKLFGIGNFINSAMAILPLVRWLAFATVIVLRPVKVARRLPSLSIVIPARNEAGNIEDALKRLPIMDGVDLEVLFVEGNSTDNTWEEINRVVNLDQYAQFNPKALQQAGKGKKDATITGFNAATKQLVTVLDADLTMPPEMVPRFYQAYCDGRANMINGNRLMYPMDNEAMRFLNRIGNIFFAKSLSLVLDLPLGDSLCGTKLFSRNDHHRMAAWLKDFGDFDPFGDFQMLFPAAELCLGSVDIPIRYGARTYGSTNIHRFRDGLKLLKMTLQGLVKIRSGAFPK